VHGEYQPVLPAERMRRRTSGQGPVRKHERSVSHSPPQRRYAGKVFLGFCLSTKRRPPPGIARIAVDRETHMTPRELQFQQQYSNLVREFEACFPGIKPPDPSWFAIWLRDYRFQATWDAIQTLSKHQLKSRFTTESTGRALSALLRQSAVCRAIASAPTGGRS
jgi:hypothetical protein